MAVLDGMLEMRAKTDSTEQRKELGQEGETGGIGLRDGADVLKQEEKRN